MNDPNPVTWICGTVILLAVLGGVFALAWHGTITGGAVVGIVATIVALAGGILGVHTGVRQSGALMARRERD